MLINEFQTLTQKVEAMTDQRVPITSRASRELPNFVEEDLFRFLLDLEIQKAIRLQYCFSVVCMTPDLRPDEVHLAFMKRVAEMATRQLRATDAVTTFSSSSIGLLLIDADIRSLPRIHKRVKEELETHPLTTGGGERRLTWSAGGSCYPQTTTSARDALHQAVDLMVRAKGEGGDRLYLPS